MVDPKSGKYDLLPHVAPGNIESFTGRLYDNVKLVGEENLISGKFVFNVGDIVYGKINPQLGKYVFARFSGLTSADAYVLNAKNGIVQKFLYAVIQTRDFYDYSVSVSKRSGMPKINRDELNAYSYWAPSESEQLKIGEYLLTLDHLITLHQRQPFLHSPPDISLIVQLTPPFYTFSWEQRKLGNIADIVGGGTPSTGNQSYWDGDIDWYAPAEIADQIYANSSQKKITGLGYENSSAKMLPPGTVLFTSRAGIGKTAILTRKGCTNQGFQSIVPHRGELDSYFIFSRTEELKRYGELVGAGSTFVEVSGKQMAVMELMMPPTMREQQTIGGFFQQLDHLITLHQRQTIVYAVIRSIRKVILAERQYFAPPMVRKSP